MAMLDSTVVNLAIESIRVDFSSDLSVAQWVATAYLCALAVSLPAAAWLGARFGYGRVWNYSLGLFVVASILCAVAPDILTLIGARVLQGLAGGLMVPAGQAVIGSEVEKKHLGRIFGWLGLAVALGPTIGPAIGGALLESTSWRWLFWINVPIGIAALIAARKLVPSGSRDFARKVDKIGLSLLGIGLPLLLFGATEMGLGELTPLTVIATGIGSVLVMSFGVTAFLVSSPLIDLHLLGRRIFSISTFITGLTGASMYGGLLLLPLYLQLVANQSPMETGLWLLIMGFGSALTLPIAGVLIDRYGAGIVALTGSLILLVGTVPFLVAKLYSPLILGVILALRGIGVALAQMPAMTAAYTSVKKEEMGDATTLVNIMQRIGGAFGAVGVVVILQQASDGEMHSTYIDAFTFLLVLSVVAFFAAALMHYQIQSHIGRKVQNEL
ncbi:EmrB/QacA subfamily drug resistance transporter [Nitrosomonas aestuarii]|nr:EmrB/QacA subfamily drug resistance transporter [Nitrosomonas aestuarii]